MKYKIYTLNRATPLVAGFERELQNAFNREISFGDRSGYAEIEQSRRQPIEVAERRQDRGREHRLAQSYPSYKHKLMHEGLKVDEYFAPIPLKCLGDPRNIDTSAWSAQQKSRLNVIRNSTRHPYFADQNLLRAYWDPAPNGPLDGYPHIRLNSPDRKGYYNILRETKAADEKIILIGYSQGGLVARYLAALDEHLFGEELIHGIITIGSPNYGSPLANPDNDESVINGVFQLVSGILGISLADHPGAHAYLSNTAGYDSGKVVAFFDHIIQDKLRQGATYAELDLFRTAKKWLSGLEDRKTTAFANLNMNDIGDPATTLGFVEANPLTRIRYGAIVNASNDLDKLLKDALSGAAQIAYELFFHDDKIDDVNNIYTDYIMHETSSSTEPVFDQKIKEYNKTLNRGGKYQLDARIERNDHDFVIPSVNQLLPAALAGHDNFVGTIVNEDTNHISGGWHKASYSRNYRNVVAMLSRLID